MDTEILRYVTADTALGITGVLCTIIDAHGSSPREAGASMWVTEDAVRGTIGGGACEHEVIERAHRMLAEGEPPCIIKKNLTAEEGLACGGSIQVYLERIVNDPELFIFGGGHVGRAIAKVADFIGFRVSVWDDRSDCITEALFPRARRFCCPLEKLFEKDEDAPTHYNSETPERLTAPSPLQFHENVYCIAVTRGHRCDAAVLRYLYGKKCAYIGMIGSFEKNESVVKMLVEEGIDSNYLDSIYKPIGLPIRAETPEEIAIAIAAELIAVRHHGNPELLRRGYIDSRHG